MHDTLLRKNEVVEVESLVSKYSLRNELSDLSKRNPNGEKLRHLLSLLFLLL